MRRSLNCLIRSVKRNAVQVVDLVLHGPRQQAVAFQFDRLSAAVVPLDDDPLRSLNDAFVNTSPIRRADR